MESTRTVELLDLSRATEFYDARYQAGYMEEYAPEVKQRLIDVLRSIRLPPIGTALDFGCGNGVLTDVLRDALPGWKIYGTELSKQALLNARARFPSCKFLEINDPELNSIKFDFLFSHHVLEHVSDLAASAEQIDARLGPSASMLHVLPCGNEGSFEYRLCALRKDGFNARLGGRFFFEDEGHLRRLTTDEMRALFGTRGFVLEAGYYTHQRHGAIEWLTNLDFKTLRSMTELSQAKDAGAAVSLAKNRIMLLAIAACRRHARLCAMLLRDKRWSPKRVMAAGLLLPFFPLTKIVNRHIEERAKREWQIDRLNPAGSEMALYFTRSHAG